MTFPSYIFIFVFLPTILLLWWSPLSLRGRLFCLTTASYIFYGWWDWRFIALLAASTLTDYLCGRAIADAQNIKTRKFFLGISLAANLTSLGFFKYYNFFIESTTAVLDALNLDVSMPVLNVVLPIGISFYTFQSLSYTIDIFRHKAQPAPSLLHFAAYVALFPQLVAGPIVRYELMADQLQSLASRHISRLEITTGWWFFIIGLSKKLLLADRIAPIANTVFDGVNNVTFVEAWSGTLAYTLQLYFDFSAYSDMAIGLGLMLGFQFPINFLSPYKSRNISDFWNKWHITLSHFLRDYLFIPLGGSRHGLGKTIRNLSITMLLGGLWHGAQWTFVFWGAFHGVLLATHASYSRLIGKKFPNAVAIALTFFCVSLGWVVFRAPDFDRARTIYTGLFGLSEFGSLFELTVNSTTFGKLPAFVDVLGGPERIPFFFIGLIIVFFFPNSHEMKRRLNAWEGIVLAMAFFACVCSLASEIPFIYSQF